MSPSAKPVRKTKLNLKVCPKLCLMMIFRDWVRIELAGVYHRRLGLALGREAKFV
jgi:hypothetical protein